MTWALSLFWQPSIKVESKVHSNVQFQEGMATGNTSESLVLLKSKSLALYHLLSDHQTLLEFKTFTIWLYTFSCWRIIWNSFNSLYLIGDLMNGPWLIFDTGWEHPENFISGTCLWTTEQLLPSFGSHFQLGGHESSGITLESTTLELLISSEAHPYENFTLMPWFPEYLHLQCISSLDDSILR